MKISETLKIIRALADGINPFTGEIFQDDSPYQNPQMVRALYKAIEALESQEKREQKKKQLPENAGMPWYENEDSQLISEFDSGISLREIARKHKRTFGAIESHLVKLGKIEGYSR